MSKLSPWSPPRCPSQCQHPAPTAPHPTPTAPQPTPAPGLRSLFLSPCHLQHVGSSRYPPSARAAGTIREHRKMSAASMAAEREGRSRHQHLMVGTEVHRRTRGNLCPTMGTTLAACARGEGARLALGNLWEPSHHPWCPSCQGHIAKEGFELRDRQTDTLWGSVAYFEPLLHLAWISVQPQGSMAGNGGSTRAAISPSGLMLCPSPRAYANLSQLAG